jgi:preprotein translocase subunit SecF
MKHITTKNLLLSSSIALAMMIFVYNPAFSWSAEPAEGEGMKMENKMMEKCEEMHKEKRKMQAEMETQDAELTAAVATMNSAEPDKKPDLVARVVTQLVEQRTAAHVQMAKMEEKMMKHMKMGKESMSTCPMMKDMDDKSGGKHAEHHDISE